MKKNRFLLKYRSICIKIIFDFWFKIFIFLVSFAEFWIFVAWLVGFAASNKHSTERHRFEPAFSVWRHRKTETINSDVFPSAWFMLEFDERDWKSVASHQTRTSRERKRCTWPKFLFSFIKVSSMKNNFVLKDCSDLIACTVNLKEKYFFHLI